MKLRFLIAWSRLSKLWIMLSPDFRKTNCIAHWKEIYPVDSDIHVSNNCGQMTC